jgi:hypothetical protein
MRWLSRWDSAIGFSPKTTFAGGPAFFPKVANTMKLKAFALVIAMAALLSAAAGAGADPVTRNIGVFGDSLGDGVYGGLYGVVKTHPGDNVFHYSKVGAGLTRPDYAMWFTEFTAELDRDHITNAVVMFGSNDQQGIRDENRKGYIFPTDGWKAVYSARVDGVLAEFAKRKIPVIWLGLPIMRKDEMNAGATVLDAIFEAESQRRGALFVPLMENFKGTDGGFATHLPDSGGHLRQVRADDGIHFTPYGYDLIANTVYAAIASSAASDRAQTTAR